MTLLTKNATIYKHLQRLASLKKEYLALRTGTQREMWVDENFYAFSLGSMTRRTPRPSQR